MNKRIIFRVPESSFTRAVLAALLLGGSVNFVTAQRPFPYQTYEPVDVRTTRAEIREIRAEERELRLHPRPPTAVLYWDTTAGAGNGVGGSATWTTQADARWSSDPSGSATLVGAATTDDGVFQGTAGTITLGGSLQLASWTFNTTNYVIASNSATTRTMTGPFSLANNVNLNVGVAVTADRIVGIAGSLTGGTGSRLTIQGAQTVENAMRLNLASSGATISVPITIGISGAGLGGLVATATGTQISGTILNNSTGATMLGATSGNDLTVSGVVSGTANVRFQGGSGSASVGAGTVVLNAANNYTGASVINMGATGTVRLGVDNALSSTSALEFGTAGSTSNVGILDMNGKNQTVASLVSNTTGTISGIRNAAANPVSTLTIQGSATTTYAGPIGSAGANNVALVLSATNTGTLTLSGSNGYTGGTTVNGGFLVAGADSALGAGNVDINATGSVHLTLQNGATNNYISDNATLSLVSGAMANLNFTGTSDTVGGLVLGGVTQTDPGTYGSSASGAMHQFDNFFTGNGTLSLIPEPSTWVMTIMGAGLLMTVQRFRRKQS